MDLTELRSLCITAVFHFRDDHITFKKLFINVIIIIK